MAEIVNSASQNESKPHVNHQHSTFPIVFDSFDTHQFGYVRPHLAVLGVPSDSFKHRPIVKTKSYTLKAPLMQDVYRKLSYFKVNLDAVLPLNAEKVYTNPVIGDDVPSGVNCVIENGFSLFSSAVEAQLASAFTSVGTSPSASTVSNVIRALVFGELFYSRGSLIASLGAHLYSQFKASLSGSVDFLDYDDYFDLNFAAFVSAIGSNVVETVIDGKTYYLNPSLDQSKSLIPPFHISPRDFLGMIRETGDWSFSSSADSIFTSSPFPTGYSRIFSFSADAPFNVQRVLSYQLACAEFFSNDKVDYIYSAELFRQYIGDLISIAVKQLSGDSAWPANFTYNGVSYQYDYLSGYYFSLMLNYANSWALDSSSSWRIAIYQYFLSCFGLKRSLRYKDYFVGSRTTPLAVGDVSVSVNSNLVNVVDVTRKIQLQRFLNVVNHTGRRLSNYVKSLFGVDLRQDRHVPQWLADLTEHVYTSEVENTGSNQLSDPQSVTAVFTGNSSNKEIEFGVDVSSCIIGVTTYDIERAYINTIDRDFFIKDRFDMFVPELQFVGDQPIYAQELVASDSSSFGSAMGYQFRDQQWKLIFSRASGGFVGKLPGYAFVSKPYSFFGDKISPDFIRSFPTEFDNFFVSLVGYSLGNYFHFIVWTKNEIIASRPMIANPVILE